MLLGIMTPDESNKHWWKMPLPISLSVVVAEMTDEEMGMNVTYFDPDTLQNNIAGTDSSGWR